MQITRRRTRMPDPFFDENGLMDAFFRRMQTPSATPLTGEDRGWRPAVELTDRGDAFVLTAELPGVKRDDIEVDLEENVLTLRGSKEQEEEEKNERYFAWERSYGSFERSFTLPRSVIPEKIEAEFADGVLTVHLPKKKEARGRSIEVASG